VVEDSINSQGEVVKIIAVFNRRRQVLCDFVASNMVLPRCRSRWFEQAVYQV
jgi:hypothetical protein